MLRIWHWRVGCRFTGEVPLFLHTCLYPGVVTESNTEAIAEWALIMKRNPTFAHDLWHNVFIFVSVSLLCFVQKVFSYRLSNNKLSKKTKKTLHKHSQMAFARVDTRKYKSHIVYGSYTRICVVFETQISWQNISSSTTKMVLTGLFLKFLAICISLLFRSELPFMV